MEDFCIVIIFIASLIMAVILMGGFDKDKDNPFKN